MKCLFTRECGHRELAVSAICFVTLFLFAIPLASAQQTQHISRADQLEGYRDRAEKVIDYYAYNVDSTDLSRGGYYDMMGKLARGIQMDWVEARLDELLPDPRGDMFWMFPFLEVQYVGRNSLSPEYRAKMRRLWTTYMPFRGDTENHWAMYYSSMYLVTQMYPDEPGEMWFNGKSSQENFDEAEDYLIDWMRISTTIGQGEYDSPGYLNFYIIPMAQLYAYAEDPAMKLRAEMMLDFLLADFAVESLNGVHAGASSRIYPKALLQRWRENSSGLAWLLFDNTPFQPKSGSVMLALSGYEPPEILYHIATDRSTPYVHRELKRTRHRIRNSDVKNLPVYKYAYMREEYTLGSTQGGLLQPIQQHTWELQWAIDDPEVGYNMFFTTNPSATPEEGTMYFGEQWDMVSGLIARSKVEYEDPDKWTGGSPHEFIVQSQNALIALYSIPKGAIFSTVSGFFSRRLEDLTEHDSGWIFARGGKAYIAYHPLAKYIWRTEEDGSKRLFSTALQNGGVLQVGSDAEDGSFESFMDAVVALPLEYSVSPVPSVAFTSLRGETIEVTYGKNPIIDGKPVDYENWPLYEGPFLNAAKGSEELNMSYGKLRRKLDFKGLSIIDHVEQ